MRGVWRWLSELVMRALNGWLGAVAALLGLAGLAPFIATLFILLRELYGHLVEGRASKLFQNTIHTTTALGASIVCAGLIACAVVILVRLKRRADDERSADLSGVAFGVVLVLIGAGLAAISVMSPAAATSVANQGQTPAEQK